MVIWIILYHLEFLNGHLDNLYHFLFYQLNYISFIYLHSIFLNGHY
jgi:hypothetical protein